MEYSGYGAGGSADGEDQDADNSQKKKRYHRHTANQIQKLEAMFKDCPHPDEKQRLQLSEELGLSPRQIKFWFQNRRTQMKTQHERADNCALRAENDKIRSENIAIREALKNVICPACGGPPNLGEMYFDEQKLRNHNAQLKGELERVSNIAARYIGRPINQPPSVLPSPSSSLSLSVGGFGETTITTPAYLDPRPNPLAPASPMALLNSLLSDMDKSHMAGVAAKAMDELLHLLQTNEPLWIRSTGSGKDILDIETYRRMFPKGISYFQEPGVRQEASRDSAVVFMSSPVLVDLFLDANRWTELFPTIVSTAKTIELVPPGEFTGSMQMMYEELHVLSPFVPTREFYILRYCQQLEQGLWAVVNVSLDIPQLAFWCPSRKLPSGCLIQDMPNGYSKVTWLEHVVVQDKPPMHQLYRQLILSGEAFGAERWVATLQRTCERIASLMVSNLSIRDFGGVMPSPHGRRSMMALAHRMVKNFCIGISTSNNFRNTAISGLGDVGARITLRSNLDSALPNGVVLCASKTFCLPISPVNAFNFFKDERTRAQWDVLSSGNDVQEVSHISNGPNPGNCISVLRALNTTQNNMWVLQETCVDSSGSLIVYCPVDISSIKVAMSGDVCSSIPLLPSGFTISPDGNPGVAGGDGASTSAEIHAKQGSCCGSLITVGFQILVSNLPSAKLNLESVSSVNNLINSTVQQIKAALNCSSP